MSTDTERAPSKELVELKQVEHVLLHGGEFATVTEDEIQTDMVQRILAAETLEEAFATFESTPLDAVLGAPVQIDGVAWLQSSFREGSPVYALLKLTLLKDHVGTGKKGDELTVSMGGRTTMAAFVWAQRHAAMPFNGTFTRERSKANPERSFIVFKLA